MYRIYTVIILSSFLHLAELINRFQSITIKSQNKLAFVVKHSFLTRYYFSLLSHNQRNESAKGTMAGNSPLERRMEAFAARVNPLLALLTQTMKKVVSRKHVQRKQKKRAVKLQPFLEVVIAPLTILGSFTMSKTAIRITLLWVVNPLNAGRQFSSVNRDFSVILMFCNKIFNRQKFGEFVSGPIFVLTYKLS